MRMRFNLCAFLVAITFTGVGVLAQSGSEQRTTLDRPIRTTLLLDGRRTPIRGEITAWTFGAFWTLRQGGEYPVRIGWDQLQPGKVFQIMQGALDRDDAEGYLRLGIEMLILNEPKVASRAFRIAERVDPDLKPAVAKAMSLAAAGDDPLTVITNPEILIPEAQAEEKSADSPAMARARGLSEKMPFEVVIHASEHFIAVVEPDTIPADALAANLELIHDHVSQLLTGTTDGALFEGRWVCHLIADPDAYKILRSHLATGEPSRSAFFSVKDHGGFMEFGFRGVKTKYLSWDSVMLSNVSSAMFDSYRSEEAFPIWLQLGMQFYVYLDIAPDRGNLRKTLKDAKNYCKYNNVAVFARRNDETFILRSNRMAVCYLLVEFFLSRDPAAFRRWIDGIKDGDHWDHSIEDHFEMDLDRLCAMFEAQLGAK